jgi:hypothetical protein
MLIFVLLLLLLLLHLPADPVLRCSLGCLHVLLHRQAEPL